MALIDCPECGNQVSTGARECPACGHPLMQIARSIRPAFNPRPAHVRVPVQRAAYEHEPLSSSMAMAGMVCGVGGAALLFVPFLWFLSIVPNLLGIIISAAALGRIGRGEQQGWGLAVTGVICGTVATICYGLLWLDFQRALHQFISN